jgi:glyoxylase-like metal-dependent hydrolase (beta-lactamase superfamily II)
VVAGAGDAAMFASGRNAPLCPTGFIARRRRSSDEGAIYTPTVVDVAVDGPLALGPIAGVDATVTPVPGHTPGSLVVTAGAAVFVGDLFRGAIVGDGAELHFYMCDVAANRADVQRVLREIAPSGRVFFTGHFGPVERAEVAGEFGR